MSGVLIATLEARVVNRDRRSFFDAPKIPAFPSVVLVGLVDQPVPTVVGIPQQTPYPAPPPTSYGSQPLPYSPQSQSYPPYSPPSYPPPSYQPPSYSPPSYAPPSSSPYAPQPPSYMAPPMPYQTPQYMPMYAPAQAPMPIPPQAQQPPASEQLEQSVPVPKDEHSNVDPTAEQISQPHSNDSLSTNLTNESKSDDSSNWEASTSSALKPF